jgi:hypothetical protein
VSNNPKNNTPEDDYLRHIATRGLGDTELDDVEARWGTAHFGKQMDLVLQIRGSEDYFIFDAETVEELVLGRFDPDTNFMPQVNLQDYGGAEKGVSRRHALIIRREGLLNLVDSGSHNGTFLNGQRLVPNQPRLLRDGDELRLGYLVLSVRFVRRQIG